MRVVCAFHPRHLRRGTVDALVAQASHTEFVDVSDSPDAYHALFARLWADRRDFALVEHDIVIADGTLAALEECPEPWCSCPIGSTYARTGFTEAYFQCNRWRAEIMAALPYVPELFPPQRYWGTLDSFLLRKMRPAYAAHAHLDRLTFHLAPGLGSTQ